MADVAKSAAEEKIPRDGTYQPCVPSLSAFIDLVRLADHPGDVLSYRHFRMTPLAAAKYPSGIPPVADVSTEMAALFASRGLAGGLRLLRALLPSDPAEAWSEFTECRFSEMVCAAAEFERTMGPGTMLSDFPPFLASCAAGRGNLV